MDKVARRLELLKLEGLGFAKAEIVNELSQKLTCSKRVLYKDFESREVWQPVLQKTGEITKALCSVGFASPPDWLKSYDCLSQGEKMRVDVARALCLEKPLIVFDEFTSVVDREIAKVSAFAISKAVRRSRKRFIAATCHYDVVDWLQPDWVFCTETMEFSRKKEAGRPLNSKSIGASLLCGRYFGTITI